MDKWEKRYHREHKARVEAETLLEGKSRELFQLNESLEKINKNLEELVKERTSKYLKARNQAIQTTKKKSEFIANISHDLRSPLHIIIGLAEEILSQLGDESLIEKTDLLLKACRNQMCLLNEILDLSRIEQGKFNLERSNFNLQSMLHTIISMHEVLVNNNHIEINLVIDNSVPKQIYGDESRLRQILTNLMGNAVKNTQRGFIKLTASIEGETKHQIFIRFSVIDTGKGIDEARKTDIFNRYFQIQNESVNDFQGLGLGLSICSKLVKLMKGRIDCESTLGKRTNFWIIIPFEKYQKKPDEKLTFQHYFLSKNLKSLCIDDENSNLFLMKLRLKKLGLEVLCRSNAQEALNDLLSEKYDIIFLDLQMPGMNGYQFLEKANIEGLLNGEIIIIMTANLLRIKKDYLIKLGVDDFLSKPFAISELEGILLKYFAVEDQ